MWDHVHLIAITALIVGQVPVKQALTPLSIVAGAAGSSRPASHISSLKI
jgi:hypothetical protein